MYKFNINENFDKYINKMYEKEIKIINVINIQFYIKLIKFNIYFFKINCANYFKYKCK